MDFHDVVSNVPDYKFFFSLDEMDESTRQLAERYPDIVTVSEIGKSRNGHPLWCIRIGDGPKNALCFACPHPNEPIGAMTMEYFSRALAENRHLREELGFTWYIIKCVDPDGLKLNENWFKGPFDIFTYSRNFYRPAGYEQVEWTFPLDYKNLHFDKPLPETEAIMKLIRETKPAFMYSLHNAGFGGAYWYLSKDIPEVYPALYKTAEKQQVSLSLGEPEAPYAIEYAPGIFKTLEATQIYDYLEKFTGDSPNLNCGTSGAQYASSQCDCVTLMTELPYFFDERIADLRFTSVSRKDVIEQGIALEDKFFENMNGILQTISPYISTSNPFLRLVNEIVESRQGHREAQLNLAKTNPEFTKPATVSQEFDSLYKERFYNGLSLGMVVRACEFEIHRLSDTPSTNEKSMEVIQRAQEIGETLLRQHCDELESQMNYTVIPIQRLVKMQLECGLILASYVHKNM